ncbi:TMV resistance protein N [Vitis vinifera]|uniref:ADP-ribosyl cyclase/cyclic ADP-ribose hydrolase n=1 Tax=Vitis vinifera TaxID=29760 RepID=A0A438FSH1_VITVI|nr:TMV resistance protein N [Vitis vinifera]
MASTSTQIASSSYSYSTHGYDYDVFLSFRGEDTRKNFTDHLYSALVANGVRTFRDDEELERGEIITTELLDAIEKSKIFIVVFSKYYAHSKWCLNELVKIVDRLMVMRHTVLPIFYHVEPSEVRKQTGSYGEAFVNHEQDVDVEKEKVEKWKAALREAGNISGWHLHNQ